MMMMVMMMLVKIYITHFSQREFSESAVHFSVSACEVRAQP